MRAARLFGPADLRIVDLPVPLPAAGQALVRVRAYSPYGTDVGVYLNRHGRYVADYPVGIGADFSGEVAAVGAGVENVAPGDRVSALALDHCGACANCRAGRTNLCLDPAFARPPRQTCCEEYALVSARKLARVPDGVAFEDAAMLAGVVDALNAFDKMALIEDDEVAIVGVGAMGQGAVATARALGLRATAIGGRGARTALARTLGAQAVYPIAAHDHDVAGDVLRDRPHGFAAIMETTASDWGMRQAFGIAAPGATVALTGGGALPVTNWDIVDRELRLVGVRAGPDQRRALDLIARGRIDLKPAVSTRFPLERAADAFALLAGERAKDVGRVLILMDDPA
jgi:threonine dehydrogenase-like Zn-dependent dehydrogenase